MVEGQAEIEIGRIRKQLAHLQDEKKTNKKVKIVTRLLILVMFSVIAFLLYQQIVALDAENVKKGVMQEIANMSPVIAQETLRIVQNVSPVYIEEIQKQIDDRQDRIVQMLKNESHVFLRIADDDISKAFEVHYPELLEKQKQHLYEAFPEMKNREKVNKAIDNIIAKGGPRLQEILDEKFNRHESILNSIQQKMSKLEDKRFKNDKYLAQKTLGVTLELVGKKLQHIEEEVK